MGDNEKIIKEYLRIREWSYGSADLKPLDIAICNMREDGISQTIPVCNQICQERDLDKTSLEYCILQGKLPQAQKIVDYLRSHPSIKDHPDAKQGK